MASKQVEHPLGLAEGSVRAILTLMLTVSMIAAMFLQDEINPYLLTLASTAIGYYIGVRKKVDPESK